jgi:erythromycin esterase-like protein
MPAARETMIQNFSQARIGGCETLSRIIAQAAEPLPEPQEEDFAAAFDRFADRRLVLIGESSRGTSEFYRARAAITRRLIERHGFDFVAVEADWPDAATVDRQVRRLPRDGAAEKPFRHFPDWTWRNREFAQFVAWLAIHNTTCVPQRMVTFHGLDIYAETASIAVILAHLDGADPEAAALARERYGCLTPWQTDPAVHGRTVVGESYRRHEEEAVGRLCRQLAQRLEKTDAADGLFDKARKADLLASAERHYRATYYGGAESWRLRGRHMFDNLLRLFETKGGQARGVVWAHNADIGNATFTDMGAAGGQRNLGQLCRQHFGDAAALMGLGTNHGTVAAARRWDGPCETTQLPASAPESYECCCHETGMKRFLLDMGRLAEPEMLATLESERLERFIGAVYRPRSAPQSQYARAVLAHQFDAFVWFDETTAVTPLGARETSGDGPPRA